MLVISPNLGSNVVIDDRMARWPFDLDAVVSAMGHIMELTLDFCMFQPITYELRKKFCMDCGIFMTKSDVFSGLLSRLTELRLGMNEQVQDGFDLLRDRWFDVAIILCGQPELDNICIESQWDQIRQPFWTEALAIAKASPSLTNRLTTNIRESLQQSIYEILAWQIICTNELAIELCPDCRLVGRLENGTIF